MTLAVSEPTTEATPVHRWRPAVPRLVAAFVRVVGLLSVISGVRQFDRVEFTGHMLYDAASEGAALALATISGAVMLLMAGALGCRRKRAWGLMCVVVVAAAVASARRGNFWVMALDVVLIALLLWTRSEFTARSEPAGKRAAARVLIVAGGISAALGLYVVSSTAPSATLSERLGQLLLGLVGFTPQLHFQSEYLSTATEFALNGMGALTALLVLLAWLAPKRHQESMTGATMARLRELLDAEGQRDSLGYFALRHDKAAVFSPSGKAAVAYRCEGNVCLASGDPLGDPEAWPGAIAEWMKIVDEFGYIPGVIGASEQGAIIYRRAGLDAFEIGDEAILDLKTWNLEGRSMRVVRQAVNRVARAGYTSDVRRQKDLGPVELQEVITAVEAMRGDDVERGYSMALGRLGDPSDPELVISRGYDENGQLVAVLGFAPWGTKGLSLDVMRRSRTSENGTIEFVLLATVRAAAELGVDRISLNFAVLRWVFERASRVGAGPMLRVWHRILLIASRWFQIETLYRACVKYQPQWQPRFVCFRNMSDLPRVAIAALQAESFLARTRLRWFAR